MTVSSPSERLDRKDTRPPRWNIGGVWVARASERDGYSVRRDRFWVGQEPAQGGHGQTLCIAEGPWGTDAQYRGDSHYLDAMVDGYRTTPIDGIATNLAPKPVGKEEHRALMDSLRSDLETRYGPIKELHVVFRSAAPVTSPWIAQESWWSGAWRRLGALKRAPWVMRGTSTLDLRP